MINNEKIEVENNIDDQDLEYCKCTNREGTYSNTQIDIFGYWDMCTACDKKIEDGFHYYNHYDGEDHDDIDVY